jgi:adenosylcobinamide-phosphate guanylyltransferase
MAGGQGRRFMADIEKPLLNIDGRPIIDIVLESLIELKQDKIIDRIVVCTTINTPTTERYVIKRTSKNREYQDVLEVVRTGGIGYIDDLRDCIKHLSLRAPFLYLPADIPLFDPGIIKYIISIYQRVDENALAVFMKKKVYERYKIKTDLIFEYNNENIVPTGVNILDGSNIDDEQEEYKLVLDLKDIEEMQSLAYLAFNINYIENYMQFIRLYRQNKKIFADLQKKRFKNDRHSRI